MTKILSYNAATDCVSVHNNLALVRSMFASLDTNNAFMPSIKRIIYNIGKKAYPKRDENGHKIMDNGKIVMSEPMDVLTTIVFFDDDSKVVVTNSEHDGIELETKNFADGTTVKVASEHSKEIGLMYAIVKRLIGLPDKNGTIKPNGFINTIQKFVRNGYDSKLEAAKKAINDKIAKNAAKMKAANPTTPKAKNPSLVETARFFADNAAKFAENAAKIADYVNKLDK